MTRNDMLSTISSCRKRLALAEALDRAGLHGDSERLTFEVMAVVSSIAEETGGGFRKFAIRGYTSTDEFIESVAGGLGGGAAGGAALGGAPGALIGGLAGTTFGLLKTPAQDLWFQNVNGRLSRSMALASDFANGAQKLASELQRAGDANGATAILQAAQALHARVREQFDAVRNQMTQQMGISDKHWYSEWGPKIKRYYRMMRSMSEDDMVRKATIGAQSDEEEEYDPATEAEEEFSKYKGDQPGEEFITSLILNKLSPLGGGSRAGTTLPSGSGWVDPYMVGLIPGSIGWGLGKVGLQAAAPKAAGAALGKLWWPWMATQAGGMVGARLGGMITNQFHGGGKQGQVRRLAGELGQIAAEIERQLGVSMEDIKGATYSALSGGFGDQFAGEYGAGYGQQTGNKQVEEYFRNKARRA